MLATELKDYLTCMNRKLFVVETNTFIIPHFQQMGAFMTGYTTENKGKHSWLCCVETKDENVGDLESEDYLQTENEVMHSVISAYISPTLSSPFVPIPSNNFYSDGYGNIVTGDMPKHTALKKRNKTIADLYSKRIALMHKAKKGNAVIKVLKGIKTAMYNSSLKMTPAYTNFGIIWNGFPDAVQESVLKRRALSFADKHKFKILGFRIIDCNNQFIKSLEETV